MNTTQIYDIVNTINKEGAALSAITATDTASFVSLGNDILSSQTNTESYFNRMVQLCGKFIDAFRMYDSDFGDMYKSDFEWGAIVRKVAASVPEAVSDPSYDIADGAEPKPFKVYKPTVYQKLFVTRSPFMLPLTKSYEAIKEAFRSESDFMAFWTMISGELKNAKTITLDNLSRACLGNFVAETTGTAREFNLVTMFNTELGLTGADALTATTAKHSDLFLNYMMGRINYHADFMTRPTVRYNDGTKPRHTPRDKMVIRINSDLNERAKTVTQYAAFHKDLVSVEGNYKTMPFFQSAKAGEEMTVKVKRASDNKEKTVNNVCAIVYDIDALGIYKEDEWTLSSGWAADYSTITEYHHMKQLWFNDTMENFAVFTLN